jgi:hypothetical protein
MEAIYPNVSIVESNDSFINPWGLVSGKKYAVDTSLDLWKGIIKGTFSRYEKNKLMGKDEYVWSIVFMDWWGDGLGYSSETPCEIQIYLDPIDHLKFHEIS